MLVSLKGGERGGLFTAVGEPTEAAMLFSQSATTDPEVASEPSAYFATTRVTVSGTGTLSNIFGKEVIPAFPVKRFTRTRH